MITILCLYIFLLGSQAHLFGRDASLLKILHHLPPLEAWERLLFTLVYPHQLQFSKKFLAWDNFLHLSAEGELALLTFFLILWLCSVIANRCEEDCWF